MKDISLKEKVISGVVIMLSLCIVLNILYAVSLKEYNNKLKHCIKQWESEDYCAAIINEYEIISK